MHETHQFKSVNNLSSKRFTLPEILLQRKLDHLNTIFQSKPTLGGRNEITNSRQIQSITFQKRVFDRQEWYTRFTNSIEQNLKSSKMENPNNTGAGCKSGLSAGLIRPRRIRRVKFSSEHNFEQQVEHASPYIYQNTKFNLFS